MPSTFLKDPDDVKDYTVDFSNLLPTGAALTGSATVTADTGLTVDSSAVSDPNVTVRLSGGTAGSRYGVDVQIDSDGGETYDRKIVIVCEDV
jgi:hypothetical protein